VVCERLLERIPTSCATPGARRAAPSLSRARSAERAHPLLSDTATPFRRALGGGRAQRARARRTARRPPSRRRLGRWPATDARSALLRRDRTRHLRRPSNSAAADYASPAETPPHILGPGPDRRERARRQFAPSLRTATLVILRLEHWVGIGRLASADITCVTLRHRSPPLPRDALEHRARPPVTSRVVGALATQHLSGGDRSTAVVGVRAADVDADADIRPAATPRHRSVFSRIPLA